MLPSSNSGQSSVDDGQAGPSGSADESFLASVASIWDAEISDLTTADAPFTDAPLALDAGPVLDADAAVLTLPTPDSVCAAPSRSLT